jgi:hypothetical protein
VTPELASLLAATIAAAGAIAAALIALSNRGKLSEVESGLNTRLSHVEGQLDVLLRDRPGPRGRLS